MEKEWTAEEIRRAQRIQDLRFDIQNHEAQIKNLESQIQYHNGMMNHSKNQLESLALTK